MRWVWVVLGLALSVARAEAPVQTTTLEVNLWGLPLVKATLFRADGTSQELRMVLDTGAEMTVIDRSLEPAFWSDDEDLKHSDVEAHAANGAIVPAEPVLLRQVQCGPISQTRAKAIRLDLTALNRTMDIPISGFIGMNLLRGQRFRLDLQHQLVRWGETGEGLFLRDLTFPKTRGVPYIQVEMAGHRFEATCDTGLAGFMSMAQDTANRVPTTKTPQSTGMDVDVAGAGPMKQTQAALGAVGVGPKQWCTPDVEVAQRNILGVYAMWPSVWFDFNKNQVGFEVGPNGCLQSKPTPRQPLHGYWDRSGARPRLVVLGVKPGSLYETAGIHAGDTLLQFGELKGGALNLMSLREAVLAKKTRWVVIQRKGQSQRIELPEEL